jgi:hypothetical protein
VRLRCDLCEYEEERDRELLIKSIPWGSSTALADYRFSCARSACQGMFRYAGAIPWCDDPAELRRRVAINTMLNLACRVLEDAAYTRCPESEKQPPVRLALRVVQAFGADATICTAYWTKETDANPSLWDGAHYEVGWIVQALVRRG